MLKNLGLFARMIGGRRGSKIANRIRPTLETLEARIVPADTWYWTDGLMDHKASEAGNWALLGGQTGNPQPGDTIIFDSAHSGDYVLWNAKVEVSAISVRRGIEWKSDQNGGYVQSDTSVTISGTQLTPATLVIDSLDSNDGVLKLTNGSIVTVGLSLWQGQFSTLQIKAGGISQLQAANSITEDAGSVGSSSIKISSDGEMDYTGDPSDGSSYQDNIEPFIVNNGIFTASGGFPTASQAGATLIMGSKSSATGYSFENDASVALEGSVVLAMNSGGDYAQVFNTTPETDSIGGRSTTNNVLSVSGGGKITITKGYITFAGSSNTSFSDLRFAGGNVETKCEVDLNFDASTSGKNDVLEDSDTNITWQWDAGSSVSATAENLFSAVDTGQWKVVQYVKQWTISPPPPAGSLPTPSVGQPYHGLTTNQTSNSFMEVWIGSQSPSRLVQHIAPSPSSTTVPQDSSTTLDTLYSSWLPDQSIDATLAAWELRRMRELVDVA